MTENSKAFSPLVVKIAEADTPNKNQRVYPREELEKITKMERVFVTMGYCEGASVNLDQVVGQVGNFKFDDKGNLLAELAIMKTPNGKIIEELIAAGSQFDYRTAGIATLEPQEDGTSVVRDFRPAYVAVLPSGSGA
jgi:hypothetical protein